MKISFLLSMLLIVLSGCSKEYTDDIDFNVLEPQEKIIECAPGFEGPFCQKRQIDRYLGEYRRGSVWCTWTETQAAGPHRIAESPLGSNFFEIHDDLHDAPIQAEVDGWSFSIPRQENYITHPVTGQRELSMIEGFGWMDIKKRTLVYQLYTRECQITLKLPSL